MVKHAQGALLESIRIDAASPRSVGSQVAAGLRHLILGGGLKVGDRLPATRTLARDLGIARSTVIECFEQLAAEGLVEARVGAGTYVSRALAADRPAVQLPRRAVPTVASPPRISARMATAAVLFAPRLQHEPRAFTTAMPAFEALPASLLSRLSAKVWRRPRGITLGYQDPAGLPELRRAVAAHLAANRGVAVAAEEVFVVAGAQQGFELVALTLVDPGDRVWFENPGPIGARNTLLMHGAELVPLPVDRDGMVVERGLAEAPAFRLALVTPSHQQPLGSRMSLERRFALLGAAERADAYVVEDDWDGDLCFAGRPLPTLKGVDQTGRVILVGSFSKTLFPALRLGFIVPPPALVPVFAEALAAFSPGVPHVHQAVVADFIDEGHYATHVRRMRRLYAERHDALQAAARRHLGGVLDVLATDTGLHTVGILRNGLSGEAAALHAARHGVSVVPVSRFALRPVAPEGLVLGFSGVTPVEIDAGVRTLADALGVAYAAAGPRADGGFMKIGL